jgi:thiol-disulfide isomerase/thioredoxin
MGIKRFLNVGTSGVRAPSLDNAKTWLNSPPLAGVSLRGHVVAYQFWTYTCVNWLRTFPCVRAWANQYREHGLVVVGIHTPEFGFEGDAKNVREAAAALGVDYPVVIDSDYAIWQAFDNHYWPALYVADANGTIRYHHFGEGAYDQSEQIIRELLTEAGARDLPEGFLEVVASGAEVAADWDRLGSPETYVGSSRSERFVGSRDQAGSYLLAGRLGLNQWSLGGMWTRRSEAAVLDIGAGTIAYRFLARDVNLVLTSNEGAIPFRVRLDGEAPGAAHGADCDELGAGAVDQPRLYQLVRQHREGDDHLFEITFDAPGVAVYVFTFG